MNTTKQNRVPDPLVDCVNSLCKAWSGDPRPEIKSTFFLGVAEGVLLAKTYRSEELVNMVGIEIKKAHADLNKLPWWRRFFIRV